MKRFKQILCILLACCLLLSGLVLPGREAGPVLGLERPTGGVAGLLAAGDTVRQDLLLPENAGVKYEPTLRPGASRALDRPPEAGAAAVIRLGVHPYGLTRRLAYWSAFRLPARSAIVSLIHRTRKPWSC